MLSRISKLPLEAALWVTLLIVPLVIGLGWGAIFDADAYAAFRSARNLADGRGLAHDLAAGLGLSSVEGGRVSAAPLYVLVLALLARMGAPLLQAGLVLSVLGWGAAAIAIYCAGRALDRPVAALAAAALAIFCPVVISTLGTEASWMLALAWTAVAASLKKRLNVQACALALMLSVHFDLGALVLAAAMLAVQWVQRGRFPLQIGLVLAVAGVGWALVGVVYHVPLILRSAGSLNVRQLLAESEFYWLFVPLIFCGAARLFALARKGLWGGLLWAAASVLSGGAASEAVVVGLALFLTGLGIDWVIEWAAARKLVRLDRATLAASVALVAVLPLGVAQASSLVHRYRFRPVIRQAIERQAAERIRARSDPAVTVFGSERVGYLADRPTLAWDGSDSDPAAVAAVLRTLNANPPEYCVSFGSIGWDHLMRTGWFRNNYTLQRTLRSPYDAASPFRVWRYRFGDFDLGERRPLDVHLPEQVELSSYQYGPNRIQPGGAVHTTLFLQATQPISDPFRLVAWVISPHDGVGWAQREVIVSAESGLVGWWQAGEPVATRLVLTTTPDIPVGAYQVKLSVAEPYSVDLLPIYRGDDTAPLDQVVLGDVVVPWQGEFDADERLDADFGHQIRLLGFDAVDGLSPGLEFDVRLYWEALRPPDDDYVVFVHLVDAEGQVAASHDGQPLDGRYTTGTWIPGEVVPDVHRLALDAGVPAGVYRLQVGLYRWPSMDRLAVWDGAGVEQAGGVVVLGSVVVEGR